MDDNNTHYLLLGAGVILFIVAFVLKKTAEKDSGRNSAPNSALPPKLQKKLKAKHDEQVAVPEDDGKPKVTYGKIFLYFGSQTGTAANYAKLLAEEAAANQFQPVIVDLQDFDPYTFVRPHTAFFLMSNQGEGEPTDNAEKFFEWLSSDHRTSETLKNVKFSVFGLGNRQYQFFNNIGKKTNAFLEKYGSERIYKYGEGDDDGSLEDDFNDWKVTLWKELKEKMQPVSSNEVQKDHVDELPFHVVFGGPEMKEIDLENYDIESDQKEYDFQTKSYLTSKSVPITKIHELRQNNDEGSTLHIEFDLANSGTEYITAANVVLFPENDPKLVVDVADRFSFTLDQTFMIEENKEQSSSIKYKHSIPSPISVRTYLTKFCDLQGPLKKSTLKELAKIVTDETLKQRLLHLASAAGKKDFETDITKSLKGLYDLLVEHDIKLNLQQLINISDMIKPRYFTIASSSIKNPQSLHICVSLLENKVGEKWRAGLASGHFRRVLEQFILNPNVSIKTRLYTKDSTFHLPTDSNRPMVLVGPGAGLAPFRGFVHEKEHLAQKEGNQIYGDITLYFGCRKSNSDYIYKDELTKFHTDGVINNYYVALSRETEKTVYVQDIMKEHRDHLITTLFERDGLLYICGSIRMGNDVMKVITGLTAEHYKISLLAAALKIKAYEKEKKIVKELWE